MKDYARDDNGDIVLRAYEIPYRPQYVLTFTPGEFGPDASSLPSGEWDQDYPGFRFHLSPEALALVAEQGANRDDGIQRIEVIWDATAPGPVKLRATQAVTEEQLASLGGGD